MKPLFVLLTIFVLSLLAAKFFLGSYDLTLSGRIAMSGMLIFTAVAHFAFTKGMAMMLPGFIPYKTQIVYLTGILELLAAIGLFIPSCRVTIAWLLIVFFILILPANIYAAIRQIDYQKANFAGNGMNYLGFRIPLQMVLIVWVYFSAIKN